MAETVETAVYRLQVQGKEQLDALNASLKQTEALEKEVTKSTRTTSEGLQNRLARLDPIIKAQEQYRRALEAQKKYEEEGTGTATQRATHLELVTKRYHEQIDAAKKAGDATAQFGKKVGLSQYEVLNLSRQLQDVVVSLQGGQSLGVVLTQQGSQIFDVYQQMRGTVAGAFSQAISWGGKFVNSAKGVVTGIAGIAAGALLMASSWSSGQREIERALIGISKQSGVTVKDINAIAQGGATATGLSVDQARDAALEFVKTGAIFRDNIKAAVAVTHDFAIVTGKNATDAAKDLGAALASPLAGADALNKQFGFLDGRTRQYIATLVSQNQNQEAQAVILAKLGPAIQGATATLGPFEKMWDAVANAAIRAKNAIGAALTPRTDQEQFDALSQQNVNRGQTPARPEALAAQGRQFNAGQIRADSAALEEMAEKLREVAKAKALAFDQFKIPSLKADEAVRELLPYIEQLEKARSARIRLQDAEASEGVKGAQGLGQFNQDALNAAKVLEQTIQSTAGQTARANEEALKLAESYGTSNLEVAKTASSLDGQLRVVQAGIGLQGVQAALAQANAQHEATIVDLKNKGLTLSDATLIADKQRAVALAEIEQQQEQINRSHQQAMTSMQGQLDVIRAGTGLRAIDAAHAQAAATGQATYNNLIAQGLSISQASAQASAAQAVAMAQVEAQQASINRQADLMLQNLQLENQIINSNSASEKDRIKARQHLNQLIEQGVDAGLAEKIVTQEIANAEDERAKAEDKASENALRNIKTREDAWKAYEDGLISWSVANDEAGNVLRRNEAAAEEAAHAMNDYARAVQNAYIEAQFFTKLPLTFTIPLMNPYEMGKDAWDKGGQLTQFNPAGYTSQTTQTQSALFSAAAMFGEGGFEEDTSNPYAKSSGFLSLMPNMQGLEKQINERLKGGSGINSQIDLLLGPRSGLTSASPGLVQTTSQMLSRLTELLPEDQKSGAIQKQIDLLQKQPETLARNELLKQLTDQLEQLQKATEENTEAMNAQLDPLFSQGHEYLNSLKMGYYKAATGLSGIVTGSGGTDSTPVHMMLTPGEHVQVTPPGQTPGKVSNDNSKNVTQNITINIEGGSSPSDRFTARQRAQGFIAAAAKAAG